MYASTANTALVALLTMLVWSQGLPAVAAAEPPDFAGTNVFTSHGNQYATLRLAQDATMVEASVETDADYAGIYFVGPRTGWRLFRVGQEWFGGQPGQPGAIAEPMPAGEYDVYFVSSDTAAMTTRLRFADIAGRLEMDVVGVVSAAIAPLSSEGLDTPWFKLQSFGGTRNMATTAIAGFLIYKSNMLAEERSFQYEWRSNGRAWGCWWEGAEEVGLAAWSWTSFILPDVPAGNVTLNFYAHTAGGPTELQVYGLWIERVGSAGHGPRGQHVDDSQVAPRGFDFDAACARVKVERALGGI